GAFGLAGRSFVLRFTLDQLEHLGQELFCVLDAALGVPQDRLDVAHDRRIGLGGIEDEVGGRAKVLSELLQVRRKTLDNVRLEVKRRRSRGEGPRHRGRLRGIVHGGTSLLGRLSLCAEDDVELVAVVVTLSVVTDTGAVREGELLTCLLADGQTANAQGTVTSGE